MKPFVKKTLLGIGVVFAILAIAFIFLVREFSKPVDPKDIIPPDRAAGIPADHQWYGGVDGGTWIHCDPQNDYKEFHCSIYGESGSLFGKGVYVPSRAVVPPYEFNWGGADSIYLKDQKGEDLVLKANGWVEYAEGKAFYQNGELIDNP
jgi:hypothetical protein